MIQQVLTFCFWVVIVEKVLKLGKMARKAQSPMVRLCLVSELLLAHPIGPKKEEERRFTCRSCNG